MSPLFCASLHESQDVGHSLGVDVPVNECESGRAASSDDSGAAATRSVSNLSFRPDRSAQGNHHVWFRRRRLGPSRESRVYVFETEGLPKGLSRRHRMDPESQLKNIPDEFDRQTDAEAPQGLETGQ
jgi:hypothetical protein